MPEPVPAGAVAFGTGQEGADAAARAAAAAAGGGGGSGGGGGDPAAQAAAAAAAAAAGQQPHGSAGQAWAENWRETYAKGDEGRLAELKRFASPGAALDSYFAAKQRISEGVKPPQAPKADARPEEIAAYRAAIGVPEKPEGYLEPAALGGVAIAEHNKPLAAFLAKELHGANAPPQLVAAGFQAMQKWQDGLIQARVDQDEALVQSTQDTLRNEWGNEYTANIRNINAMLAGAPAEVADAIYDARTPDGNPLVGVPGVVRYLAHMAKELNPIMTIIPGAGAGTALADAQTRIDQINALMRNPQSEYHKGPNAEKIQKEYRDLLDAQSRMKARSAAA